jgi:hypothetical protein
MAQAQEPRRDLSFNEVWAALMELRESQKETGRKISKLGSRIGDIIKHLTASNILEEFKK